MAFKDKFIELESRAEVRVGKLYLLDRMIEQTINALATENDKVFTYLVAFFIKSLAGGSKSSEKKWQEINAKVDKLLEKIKEGHPSLKEAFDVYTEVMKYANSEHNYMFIKRVGVAESDIEDSFKEGELPPGV